MAPRVRPDDTYGVLVSQRSLGVTGSDWLTEGVPSSDGSLVAAGAPDTSDFGEAYTVTVSTSGPTAANGPASRAPIVLCAP